MNSIHLHLLLNHVALGAFAVGYAANLGGQIRHTEIRAGGVPATAGEGKGGERGER